MKKLKNTKKLIAAASALVVAVALSAGTTFAWFTSNSSVSVSGINASVKSADGSSILIAVGHDTGNATFGYELHGDDLSDYIAKAEFDALTNTNSDKTAKPTFYPLSSYSGTTASYGTAASAAAKDTSGSYIRIPLTLRTDTESQTIYLGSESKVTTTTAEESPVTAWEAIDAGKYNGNENAISANETLTAYACNATRVGFSTTSTANADESAGAFKVWSPNEAMYNGGEVVASESAYTTYKDSSGNTITTLDRANLGTASYWKNNVARDYYNYVLKTSLTSTANPQVSYSNYIEPTKSGNNTIATTGSEGEGPYYAYIYIYVWIEGTDGDCFNNILGQSVTVDLEFTLEDPS